jgi:hypothetical protein
VRRVVGNVITTDSGVVRVNGTLQVSATELSGAAIEVTDDALTFPDFQPLVRLQGPYSVDGGNLLLSGQTPPSLPFTVENGELTLRPTASISFVYAPYVHTRSETMMVGGTVRLETMPPPSNLRITLAFLVRNGFSSDMRDGAALSFTGPTAVFALNRTAGARGTERVPFGAAGIALGLVVVYEDRTASNNLENLLDSDCTPGGTTKDCVRGVSPILLGYRDADSPELTATPYAFLLGGWTPAVRVTDSRTGTARDGAASLDPTTAPLPFDVEVPANPQAVTVPSFQL